MPQEPNQSPALPAPDADGWVFLGELPEPREIEEPETPETGLSIARIDEGGFALHFDQPHAPAVVIELDSDTALNLYSYLRTWVGETFFQGDAV